MKKRCAETRQLSLLINQFLSFGERGIAYSLLLFTSLANLSTFSVLSYVSNGFVWKLQVLNRNTSSHIIIWRETPRGVMANILDCKSQWV